MKTSGELPFALKCINRELAGKSLHGVAYVKKAFRIYGLNVEGVFPVFEGIKITLQEDVDTLYHRLGNTDYGFYHGTMREATKLLKQQLKSLPHLRKLFTDSQLKEELSAQGYPIMQLVDERLHSLCKHTGGSYTWNPKHYPL